MIRATHLNRIQFYKQKAETLFPEWIYDSGPSIKFTDKAGLLLKETLIENHISPDGKYILTCTNGLKIYELTKLKETEVEGFDTLSASQKVSLNSEKLIT